MSINGMSKSQEAYELLNKSLDASSLRGKVIVNNIANINTKDYKRHYVKFEDTLKDSIDDLQLKTSEENHIKSEGDEGEISVEQDSTTSMREDGNNVDVDNEMVNLAANTLMYNALVSQVNSKLSLERYVINGGK